MTPPKPTKRQREIAKAKRERLKLRKQKAREKAKIKREARKTRLRLRIEKRKAKRKAKAAPKNRLVEWSKKVRIDGRCAVCPRTDHLQAHHLLPKERYPQFKFKIINGVALCPTHHKFGAWSAHRNSLWFSDWLQRNRPGQYQWAIEHMGIDPTELR